MPDRPKRALAETIDEHRPARRDPRAEPESVRPDVSNGSEPPERPVVRQDRTGIGPHTSIKAPPESATQAAATKVETPAPEDHVSRRPPDSKSMLDPAGASGIAALRRQLSSLQMQFSEAQGELGREQASRAEDAEEMAQVLERLANADAENESLRDDLERERNFVEELRVSVREKYEDCNTLKQKLADAETLIAKELEEAAERQALAERAERAEQEVAEVQKQLEVSRASEESVRAELSTTSSQLDILRRAFEKQEAELAKSNTALKNANMKAFAANKQLESWKAESQRTMEQTRVEQEVVLTKLAAEHAKAIEAVRGEADDATALALAAQKQMQETTVKLARALQSLDSLDEAERQLHELREKANGVRRAAIEQAAEAKRALASPGPAQSKAAPPLPSKAPRSAPAKSPPPAAPPPASPPPAPPSTAALTPTANADAVKAAAESAKENLKETLREGVTSAPGSSSDVTSPEKQEKQEKPVPPEAAKLDAAAKVVPKVDDQPYLEFGEIEMAAEELVEDLIEARNRSRR
jgi:DNA repair exonuclease SbcCD ATPase subunit